MKSPFPLLMTAVFAGLVVFFSCSKEKSIDTGAFALSSGTLKSIVGDCLPSSVEGNYKVGTTLTNTSYIELEVEVDIPGRYVITSDTINGFSFKGEGVFVTAGSNTVKLIASGKPKAQAKSIFSIRYGASVCTIPVDAIDDNAPPALFKIGASDVDTCSGFVLGGNYQEGVPVDASHFVSMTVTVTAAGAYNISIPAKNGLSFSKAGLFSATGTQTVKLAASGTPAKGGFSKHTLTGGRSCTFELNVAPKAGTSIAVYTLSGAPGNCTNPVISGTYQAGVALANANTVAVKVDVTTAGDYTLTTNIVNGIKFSATGVLAVGAGQTVLLKGSGTPAQQGANSYKPQVNTSSCTFSITADPAAPVNPTVFSCKVNGVLTHFNQSATASTKTSGNNVLMLQGYTSSGGVQNFMATLNYFDDRAIAKGSFNIDGFASGTGYNLQLNFIESGASLAVWNTGTNIPNMPVNQPFTFTITDLSATRIKGTFSGKMSENNNASKTVTITEGTFDVPVKN